MFLKRIIRSFAIILCLFITIGISTELSAANISEEQEKLEYSKLERTRPSYGVVRWDGYSGHKVWTQTQEMNFFANKPEFWHRIPWFAELTGDPAKPFSFNNNLDSNPELFRENVQKVTDQELIYAATAGIDYFAYCYYVDYKQGGWGLRYNYEAHKKSTYKDKVNYSFIVLLNQVGAGSDGKAPGPVVEIPQTPEAAWKDWEKHVAEIISEIKASGGSYQRVLGDRPLVYFMSPEKFAARLGDATGKVDNLKNAVSYFRDEFVKAGLPNPYILCGSSGGIWAKVYIDGTGVDGIWAYYGGFGAREQGKPYSTFWDNIQKDFLLNGDIGGANRKVVINAMQGNDQRPRKASAVYYTDPTPQEFGELITTVMDYTLENPLKCEANTVISYAWNEHSEGGYICPTIDERALTDLNLKPDDEDYKPNTKYLDAISQYLKNYIQPSEKEKLGTIIANYSFGDREVNKNSIDINENSTATEIAISDRCVISEGNSSVTASMGMSVAIPKTANNNKPGMEFKVTPVQGKGMLLKNLSFALKGTKEQQNVLFKVKISTSDNVIYEKIGKAEFKEIGDNSWLAMAIPLDEIAAEVKAETTVKIEFINNSDDIRVDDIRLFSKAN